MPDDATDVFLRLNGWTLEVEPAAAHEFLAGHLAAGTCSFATLTPWIQQALTPST